MNFPPLPGSYHVGTTTFHWVENARKDLLIENAPTPRELMAQLWYPSEKSAHKAPYAPDEIELWCTQLEEVGLSRDQIQQLGEVKAHAGINAQPLKKDAPYPLILFSHGMNNSRGSYTAFCEALASHGYIVASISHTNYATIVQFPDGRTITTHPQLQDQTPYSSAEAFRKEQKNIEMYADEWVADASFVLNECTKLNDNASSPFYKLIDMNNCGMLGHSFGGSTAIQMCRNNPTIKAAINLDGYLFGRDAFEPFNKPVLMIIFKEEDQETFRQDMQAEGIAPEVVELLIPMCYDDIPAFCKSMNGYASLLKIENAQHLAFSDAIFLKDLPLHRDNKEIFDLSVRTGGINGTQMLKIINTYVADFFDTHLKNKASQCFIVEEKFFEEATLTAYKSEKK